MSQKTKQIINLFSILVIVIGCIFLANGFILAWTAPTQAPTGGNVASPLNTSLTAQSKQGALVIGTNSAVTTGLVVQYGNIGIGTISPSFKLQVDANTTGWGTRIRNLTGTNNYVYMNHGTYGVHIRNDSAPSTHYLLDVYPSNGKRFQVMGDGRVCIDGVCRSTWPVDTNTQCTICNGKSCGGSWPNRQGGYHVQAPYARSGSSCSGGFYQYPSDWYGVSFCCSN